VQRVPDVQMEVTVRAFSGVERRMGSAGIKGFTTEEVVESPFTVVDRRGGAF